MIAHGYSEEDPLLLAWKKPQAQERIKVHRKLEEILPGL